MKNTISIQDLQQSLQRQLDELAQLQLFPMLIIAEVASKFHAWKLESIVVETYTHRTRDRLYVMTLSAELDAAPPYPEVTEKLKELGFSVAAFDPQRKDRETLYVRFYSNQ